MKLFNNQWYRDFNCRAIHTACWGPVFEENIQKFTVVNYSTYSQSKKARSHVTQQLWIEIDIVL